MGAYVALQKQIQDEIDRLTDESHKTIKIAADLQDEAVISLTIEMSIKTSSIKFTDDAWGYVKTFTENNWYCLCEIVDLSVQDRNGNEVDSDFDESELDLEFESSEWV